MACSGPAVRGRWNKLSAGKKAVNRAHGKIRALGEQAMATLKSWRLLRKLRCSTTRITDLVKARPQPGADRLNLRRKPRSLLYSWRA
ncbi:IS493-like transposase [Streptomyces venezuelae]|nr:IS493-like transposase [Streptomyces venezuelae]CUM35601.1 IS493-like transposase [Streptomyces venezuelae]